MFLLPSVRMMAVPVEVPLEVGYDDPSYDQENPGRNPAYIPSVIQNDYTITFLAIHPAYTLNIVANGVVVYSVALSPYTTSIVLPSWLSGQYEIQLCPDDYLKNYGYGGISVGTYYNSSTTLIEELAIVEYNELYMTPEYRNRFECVPQMDGGAIYAQTKHYRTVIRYNFISGYHGAFKSRSIYCDEGTQNTWIYGNMMINNKDYYALDLRYVNITGVDYNIRNRMLYNIMDAHYRFEGRSDIDITGTDDSLKNLKGRNIIITERYSPSSYIVVNDINTAKKESDTFLSGCKIEEYGIALPIGQKGQIDDLGLPEFICSHLRYDYY